MRRAPPVAGYCPAFEWRISNGEFPDAPAAPSGYCGHCAGHSGVAPSGQEEPYYLAGCNVWPTDPTQIADKPACTYTFTWVND